MLAMFLLHNNFNPKLQYLSTSYIDITEDNKNSTKIIIFEVTFKSTLINTDSINN